MSVATSTTLNEIAELFDHRWQPFRSNVRPFGTLTPKVDLKEKDVCFEISLEMPGVQKENLAVSVQAGVLRVEAHTKQETVQEGDKILRQERHYGKYVRNFELGPQIQASDITAVFENGILTLIAPKQKTAQPAIQHIAIK